jgi:hypothetical protein
MVFCLGGHFFVFAILFLFLVFLLGKILMRGVGFVWVGVGE